MSGQYFNLPKSIPWRQIAVSPDMMDKTFCSKSFPFTFRSSMAISVYEPLFEDLPEELCGDQITYIKITTSITGYQPKKSEKGYLDAFSDLPEEDIERMLGIPRDDEDYQEYKDRREKVLERITSDYLACYGVILNVAIFPYPSTKKVFTLRKKIDFSMLTEADDSFLLPGTTLDNPYQHSSEISFESISEQENTLVNLITTGNNSDSELYLSSKMVVTLTTITGMPAVEIKIVYLGEQGVKVQAFGSNGLVGSAQSVSEPDQVHTLRIEAEGIQKVIIISPDGKASLLEFAYFTSKDESLSLDDYPHIIDFEPKRRDLYQAATETGEVLSGSKSALSTNKALTHTESSESSVTFGASASFVPEQLTGGLGGEASVSTTQTNTETDQDQWSVQTDASRERRETQGATTQLSQMYNLITGYHAGTNRASFLSLARPHVLQPTDYRTFVQGIRAIEGMQEYFLIVSRPKGIEGLCIEASLETGHYPEDTVIEDPPEEYDETYLDFKTKLYEAKGEVLKTWPKKDQDAQCVIIEESWTMPAGYIVDQRPERKRLATESPELGWDNGHPGVSFLGSNAGLGNPTLNYGVTDGSLTVSGELCGGQAIEAVIDALSIDGPTSKFEGIFRVFLRSELPNTSHQEPKADIGRLLITNRSLCTCFKSGKCIEVVPVPPSKTPPERDPISIESIVDEPMIRMNKSLMTKNASRQNKMPLAKEFISKVQAALANSSNSASRRSYKDDVGLLDSDYFKDQIKNILPKTYLERPLCEVKGISSKVIEALGERSTINSILSMNLTKFAKKAGLTASEASKIRRDLLGMTLPDDKSDRPNSKEY